MFATLNDSQIQLLDGNIFEGIFSTFSPQLEVVLELVHTVDPSEPDKINVESVTSKVIFRSQMIVMMSSKDVELDFATKGMYSSYVNVYHYIFNMCHVFL